MTIQATYTFFMKFISVFSNTTYYDKHIVFRTKNLGNPCMDRLATVELIERIDKCKGKI